MPTPIYEAIDAAESEFALGCTVPAGFLRITVTGHQSTARRLGYFGDERFVMFYYEPRGHEVVWADRHSSGFGTGAWRVFFAEIDPLGQRLDVDLGCSGTPACHVLVIDREWGDAWFAERRAAKRFLAAHR